MPIDFPSNPLVGDTYSSGSTVWTWDGSAWVGSQAEVTSVISTLDDLNDVEAAAPSAGNFLYYNGTYWVPGTPAIALNELSDVATTNEASGDVLYRTTDGWTNQALSLNHLSNVEGAAVYGQVLCFNGASWIPRDPDILRPMPSTYLELSSTTYSVSRTWSGSLAVLTNASPKTITLTQDSSITVGMMFWLSPINAAVSLTGASGVQIVGATSVSPGESTLVWKQSSTRWVVSARSPGENAIRRHYAAIGNGSATTFTINHQFNTRDVVVTVYQNSGAYDEAIYEIFHTDPDNITVSFSVAPSTDAYRVVIVA